MKGEGRLVPPDSERKSLFKRLYPEYIAIVVVFVLVWLNAFGVFS